MTPRSLAITRALVMALALAMCLPASGMAQLSTFTYQGRLRDGGVPVNGSYDLRFILYTLAAGGSQIGVTIYVDDAPIGDGLFATDLDFGAASFPGDVRYLEVAVRPGAVSNADRDPLTYTTLNPRQRLNSTPYAIRARDADTIDGFDSSVFLTGVPNPLSMTNSLPGFPVASVLNTASGVGVMGSTPAPYAYINSGVCGNSADGVGVAGVTNTGIAMVARTIGATGEPGAFVALTDAAAGTAVIATNIHATQNTQAELASQISGAVVEPFLNGDPASVVASSADITLYSRSDAATAIYGESLPWNGVLGLTQSGHGVFGAAVGSGGVGVRAQGSGITALQQGTALQIQHGAIKVPNASLNTPTPVFIHRSTVGSISGNFTIIDHPLTNGDPNAILIITPNWNPGGVGGTYNTNPIGVFYHSSERWAIFNQNLVAMTVNQSFNVLVVKSGSEFSPQEMGMPPGASSARPHKPIPSPLEGVHIEFPKSDAK